METLFLTTIQVLGFLLTVSFFIQKVLKIKKGIKGLIDNNLKNVIVQSIFYSSFWIIFGLIFNIDSIIIILEIFLLFFLLLVLLSNFLNIKDLELLAEKSNKNKDLVFRPKLILLFVFSLAVFMFLSFLTLSLLSSY